MSSIARTPDPDPAQDDPTWRLEARDPVLHRGDPAAPSGRRAGSAAPSPTGPSSSRSEVAAPGSQTRGVGEVGDELEGIVAGQGGLDRLAQDRHGSGSVGGVADAMSNVCSDLCWQVIRDAVPAWPCPCSMFGTLRGDSMRSRSSPDRHVVDAPRAVRRGQLQPHRASAVRRRLFGWSAPPPAALAGRTVLVTGPTSGLGLRRPHVVAELGARVILVGRSRDKLTALQAELARAPRRRPLSRRRRRPRLARVGPRRRSTRSGPREDRLDVVIDNAGAIYPERTVEARTGSRRPSP